VSGDTAEHRFVGTDLSGALFRDVDLSGAKITGLIDGLTVNDVEVAPLIAAELERRHPELILFRSDDPVDLSRGWQIVRDQWRATLARIGRLPPDRQQQRVNDEWSAIETLRHLIFVADDWFGRTVRGESAPYWPCGLVPSFLNGTEERYGIDPAADPDSDEVMARLEERMAQLDLQFGKLTTAELSRICRPSYSAGGTDPITVQSCLQAVLDEFAAHRRYTERDLDALE
jgi:DinB family protein